MAEAVAPPFDRPDAGFNNLPGWTWVGTYGGYYLQADLLQNFEHGFFTRQWHGRGPEELAAYVSAGVSVHRPQQVHRAVVLPASQAGKPPWPEADGLVSDGAGQSLWVCGADCTPVLLADPRSGQVAACHAGWRGVAAGILAVAVAGLQARGCRPADLLVALGPAISAAHYPVEHGVSGQLVASLPPGGGQQLRQAGGLLDDPEPGHHRVDIRMAARLQLEAHGVPSNQISSCGLCTHMQADLFHSWRRDRVKAVQWSGIVSQA
jgi:YfiH family protein